MISVIISDLLFLYILYIFDRFVVGLKIMKYKAGRLVILLIKGLLSNMLRRGKNSDVRKVEWSALYPLDTSNLLPLRHR